MTNELGNIGFTATTAEAARRSHLNFELGDVVC